MDLCTIVFVCWNLWGDWWKTTIYEYVRYILLTVFRRDVGGTGAFMKEKHTVRNYLDTMHPLELNPSQSRLPAKPKLITTAADVAPLVDFALPAGSLRPRTTGFSPGHVRSILKFDTFGPLDSETKALLRAGGEIPQSPNQDHYRPQVEGHRGASATKMRPALIEPFSDPKEMIGGSAYAGNTSSNNFNSNKNNNGNVSSNFSVNGILGTSQPPSRANNNDPLHSSSSRSLHSRPGALPSLSVDTSSEQITLSKKGKNKTLTAECAFSPSRTNMEVLKVSAEELAALDPFTRSRMWHKSFQQSVEVKTAVWLWSCFYSYQCVCCRCRRRSKILSIGSGVCHTYNRPNYLP
jgi:hypothetical protein